MRGCSELRPGNIRFLLLARWQIVKLKKVNTPSFEHGDHHAIVDFDLPAPFPKDATLPL